MNQRQVRIAVAGLAGLFALACVAVAWRTGGAGGNPAPPADPAAAPGAALWASACADCHAPAEFTTRLAGDGRAAAAAALLQRLDDHGTLEFAEDLQVVQWLAAQSPASVAAPQHAGDAPEPEDQDDEFRL